MALHPVSPPASRWWNWKHWSLLQRALFVSLVLHAMVLTLRFASPQTWERLTDDSPLEITLVKGSGNPALDRHAQEVARSAGPFGAFTPEMRNSLDQLVVVARFSFTRDEALRTEALGAP